MIAINNVVSLWQYLGVRISKWGLLCTFSTFLLLLVFTPHSLVMEVRHLDHYMSSWVSNGVLSVR